ncbi:MAG: glycosyltransferase [Bacteroidales bacterium]
MFITLSVILLYVLMILVLSKGLVKTSPVLVHGLDTSEDLPREIPGDPPPMVTLIVPFRNEIRNLPRIVKDLEEQAWPAESVEYIFVDDHSTDGSGDWVREHIRNRPRFRSLVLQERDQGKKKALATGIRQARGEWIIQTDADCSLGPRFIAAHMAARLRTGADMIAGLVTTREEKGGILENLERLDLLGLTGVAAGSFALGRPLMCSGANLSYSKDLYLETRPYDPATDIASGDDMFMMIGARKLGRKMGYLIASDAVVYTTPAGSLRDLIGQRIRWGAKAGRYRMPDIQGVAMLTLLTYFILLVMPWLILFRPEIFGWLITGFAGKTFAEMFLLYRTAGFTGQRQDLRMFVPVLLLHYPFMGVVMTGSLFRKGKWKT